MVLYDRVGGALAVSRSFGDWHKDYFLNEKGDKLVISNPDVTTYDIDANSLVVLVCDGIVDNMCTNEEIVRVVREGTEESIYSDKELSNNQEEQEGDFKQAKILCHESLRRRLVPDNLTAIVMTFQIASKSSNNLNLTWKNLFFNKFFNSKMVSFGIPLFSIIALLYYVHNK
jgi:serine/threonine protein phosphatase PrpC